MTHIVVKENRLIINDKAYRCSFGKNGFTDNKVEGDGKTPLGQWQLGRVFYRDDKLSLLGIDITNIKFKTIKMDKTMGWSDDVKDKNYNRLITLPSEYSYENLWREDDVYNIVVEIKYNDNPIVVGCGSAIFFHIAKAKYEGTEGCIAVSLYHMVEILNTLTTDSAMEITV